MQSKNKQFKSNYKRYATYIFLIIIIVIGSGILGNYRGIKELPSRKYEDHLSESCKKIDLLNFYIKSSEEALIDSITYQKSFINLNSFFHAISGKRVIEDVDSANTVYKMDNGQLTFNYPYYDVNTMVENIKELNFKLESKGVDFLYIQAPFKINKFDNMMPWGIEDSVNHNADNMIRGLEEAEVTYVDLRDLIEKERLDYGELFYNTDHHWKIETALWASNHIQDYIKNKLNLNDIESNISINDFEWIHIPKSFLGSQGRRVNKYYGGVDDFSYCIPGFDTDYNLETYNSNGSLLESRTGSFDETILINNLVDIENSIETNRYAVYFGGDMPLRKITNFNIEKGKMLIIQDSFGLPFSAFMSLSCRNTDIIDLRHYKGESLYEYLENNKYDLVMLLYNPSAYREDNQDKLFRFRR